MNAKEKNNIKMAVFSAMRHYACRNEGRMCWANLKTLSKRSGCQTPHVEWAIDRLIAEGHVGVVENVKRSERGLTPVWRLYSENYQVDDDYEHEGEVPPPKLLESKKVAEACNESKDRFVLIGKIKVGDMTKGLWHDTEQGDYVLETLRYSHTRYTEEQAKEIKDLFAITNS